MGYTPTFLFNRNDLTSEVVNDIQEHREDESAARALAEEVIYLMSAEDRILDGTSIGWLEPDFSSETEYYRDALERYKIKFVEIGG